MAANLAINDNDTVIQYTSIGESIFTFPFPFLDNSEIRVSVDQVDKTITVDYTLSGIGAAGGGTVIFNAATTIGEIITIWQDMPFKRLTGFATGAATLLGDDLNTEFVRQIRHDQQIRRDIRAALRIAPDDPQAAADMELPTKSTRAGKTLGFDAAGKPIVLSVVSSEDASLRADLAATGGAALVGHKRAETGAVAGTVFAVLNNLLSVTSFGTVGDGVADDTAAIQAAINAAIAATVGGGVYLPRGIYRITSGLLIGVAGGTRINGFHFFGDGFKATEIVWDGGNSGTALEVRAVRGPTIERFYLRGTAGNIPDVGIDINGGIGASGGDHCLSCMAINSFQVGLRIGSRTFANDSVPGGYFNAISISDCTTAAIEILGNDCDGQHFYDLLTGNCPIVIAGEGCRNVHVHGGGHSNPTGAGQGYPKFIYMQLLYGTGAGILSGGGYSLDNLRIEGGVTLLRVALTGAPHTGNADDQQIPFHAKNVVYASVHQDVAARPRILDCAQTGTYIFENCNFVTPGMYFHFYRMANTNRFATLRLIGCTFREDTPDVEVFGNLIYINGNGGGGVSGGLRAYLSGNLLVDNVLFEVPTGIIRDRELTVIPDDADLDTILMTNATQANPCEVTTIAAHGFETADRISIIDVQGMVELNDDIYTITKVDATKFTLDGVDSTAFTAYTTQGDASRPKFRSFKDDGAIQTFALLDATPSIREGSLFQTADTTTYTDFDDIQVDDEGKRISILAKHAAVVTNGANIKTSTGANKTLVVDRLYNFISIAGVWYEDATV